MIGKNKICRFNPLAANPPLVLGVSPSKKQMGMKPKKAMLHVVYMQHCKLQCCDWTRSAYPLLLAGSPLLAEQVRQAGANCADFVYQVVYIVNIEVNDNRTLPFREVDIEDQRTQGAWAKKTPEKMVVVNFPDHHRDLTAMRGDGFVFSTPSDMAVKMYDALLHQMIYHFENPLLGGSEGTTKVGCCFAALVNYQKPKFSENV